MARVLPWFLLGLASAQLTGHILKRSSEKAKRKLAQVDGPNDPLASSGPYGIPPRASGLAARIACGKADPITDSQRAAAARIRVTIDRELGRTSEPWIVALAESEPQPSYLRQ